MLPPGNTVPSLVTFPTIVPCPRNSPAGVTKTGPCKDAEGWLMSPISSRVGVVTEDAADGPPIMVCEALFAAPSRISEPPPTIVKGPAVGLPLPTSLLNTSAFPSVSMIPPDVPRLTEKSSFCAAVVIRVPPFRLIGPVPKAVAELTAKAPPAIVVPPA